MKNYSVYELQPAAKYWVLREDIPPVSSFINSLQLANAARAANPENSYQPMGVDQGAAPPKQIYNCCAGTYRPKRSN